MGIRGASVDEAVDVDDRGWLVTVAERFGKYGESGLGSTGESSGVVMGEANGWAKERSESSGDCSDEDEEDDVAECRSGAL